MLDRRAFLSLVLAAVAATGSVVAAPVKSSPAGPGARSGPPAEFAPQTDGPLAMSVGPGGRIWAAWAYRATGEFDVAVAFRDGAGSWSSPSYVGRRDWLDEIEPAIAVDGQGTVYVAFTIRGSGHVSLAALPAGSSTWLGPVVVSGAELASSPAIRIVRGCLIVAYRTPGGVGIADFPVVARPAEILGIQDGPDGVDPLGLVPKWSDDPKRRDTDVPPPVE
jgi:hypothetical protein